MPLSLVFPDPWWPLTLYMVLHITLSGHELGHLLINCFFPTVKANAIYFSGHKRLPIRIRKKPVPIYISFIPLGGIIMWDFHSSGRQWCKEVWCITLGGPLANIVMGVISVVFLLYGTAHMQFWATLFATNLLMFLSVMLRIYPRDGDTLLSSFYWWWLA